MLQQKLMLCHPEESCAVKSSFKKTAALTLKAVISEERQVQ
jgi:hypothetical protein